MLFAVLQTVSGLMPTYTTYALVLPLLGLSVLTVITSANALVQLTSAPEMRGRVASIFLMLAIGSVPLTAPIVGWIGEEFGARDRPGVDRCRDRSRHRRRRAVVPAPER